MAGKRQLKAPPRDASARLKAPSDGGGSTQTQKVRFSFEHFQQDSAKSCDHSQLLSLVDKARQLSAMTWQQVQASHRHKLGTEIIAQDAIKVKLPGAVTPDVNVLAFRFCGMHPMLGFRDGAVFHVCWLDYDMSAYPHG